MGGSALHDELDPTVSLAPAALEADYGVKPIWFTPVDGASLNSMAQYLFELGQPAAALVWLETAMAGDTRRHSPLFAATSSLHLAAILHALDRHVAALDVLEGTLKLIETQITRTTAVSFLLPKAVAEHNMAVQQLVMDRAPAAVEICERAIATVRAYVATMQMNHEGVGSGNAAAALQLYSSQIECTWLAAARLCETPPRQKVTSRLRDSRRSLLTLAPLGSIPDARSRQPGKRRGRQKDSSPESRRPTPLEQRRYERSSAKALPTHYSKHRQRLAAVDSVVDSSRPYSFRSGLGVGNRRKASVNRMRAAWVS